MVPFYANPFPTCREYRGKPENQVFIKEITNYDDKTSRVVKDRTSPYFKDNNNYTWYFFKAAKTPSALANAIASCFQPTES